jgi:hypothetical protein
MLVIVIGKYLSFCLLVLSGDLFVSISFRKIFFIGNYLFLFPFLFVHLSPTYLSASHLSLRFNYALIHVSNIVTFPPLIFLSGSYKSIPLPSLYEINTY